MTDYSQLPEHMQGGARRYIENGIRPGDFLTAVLENNLTQAFGSADSTNRPLIGTVYVEWLYWEIPAPAWGSPTKVAAWIAHKGLEGIDNVYA